MDANVVKHNTSMSGLVVRPEEPGVLYNVMPVLHYDIVRDVILSNVVRLYRSLSLGPLGGRIARTDGVHDVVRGPPGPARWRDYNCHAVPGPMLDHGAQHNDIVMTLCGVVPQRCYYSGEGGAAAVAECDTNAVLRYVTVGIS